MDFELNILMVCFNNHTFELINFNDVDEIKYVQKIQSFEDMNELNLLMYKYRHLIPQIKKNF
jgi:hypothetical protein